MQIWLVEVVTGVYEDRRTEILRVCSSEKTAEKCKTALEAELVLRKLDTGNAIKSFEDIDWDSESREFYGFFVDTNGAWLHIRGPYSVED